MIWWRKGEKALRYCLLFSWFRGRLTEERAFKLLRGRGDGSYILRLNPPDNTLIISFCLSSSKQVVHLPIETGPSGYLTSLSPQAYHTIEKLVSTLEFLKEPFVQAPSLLSAKPDFSPSKWTSVAFSPSVFKQGLSEIVIHNHFKLLLFWIGLSV